jgi:hypothetical protein
MIIYFVFQEIYNIFFINIKINKKKKKNFYNEKSFN